MTLSGEHFEILIREWATRTRPETFAFLGSILEEIIPPIPSSLIMILSGSLVVTHGEGLLFLVWIAFVGALGKVIASWVFYVLGDKLEDVVLLGRFGRVLGISHESMEGIGRRLNGSGKDELILFLMRAIPAFPTLAVSILCGIIRMNVRSFLGMTLLGTFVRNILYVYVGYMGVEVVASWVREAQGLRIVMTVVLMVGLVVAVRRIHSLSGARKEKCLDVPEKEPLN